MKTLNYISMGQRYWVYGVKGLDHLSKNQTTGRKTPCIL